MTSKQPDLSNFPEIDMPKRILLGPGPSMVNPRVLRVMATPMVGHLDPDFIKVMNGAKKLLRYVFQTENDLTLPISGTGSAAMEAAICNTIEPGDKVLIAAHGFFGLRMYDMAQRYGADVELITCRWGDVFSTEDIKAALDKHPAKVVGIVHAETSTGALQPLKEIADLVHERGGILLVDAVASMGGVPLKVDELDLDVVYSGSQKCLSCPPGASPITFGPRALEVLKNRKTKVANWYLDVTAIQSYWGEENRTYHHTAPITSIFALYEGLRVIAEEGLENVWARHQANAEFLWEGLEEMDMTLHVPEQYRIPALTTVQIPPWADDMNIRSQLMADYNLQISGGLGELKGKVWRIGLMGHSSRRENVELLLAALRRLLKQ
jgi:alanine-glyoxylate transaminase / serine-glyoxylate transaminase / serine-pyruvate transaminase